MTMMQAIKADLDSEDLFSMTAADIEKMRRIARRQARAPLKVRQAAPNPDIETAMIKALADTPKPPCQFAKMNLGRDAMNAERQHEARKAVLSAITEPMTEAQIAKAVGRSESTIWVRMRDFQSEGLVDFKMQEVEGRSRPIRLWFRTGAKLERKETKPTDTGLIRKGDETRALVLAQMDKPCAAFQIAPALGMQSKTVVGVLKELRRRGLIRHEGEVCTPRGKPVKAWVRT
jgi:predicted ArsR family transcriptional regulator